MIELHILTRCFRPQYLVEIKNEIFKSQNFLIKWWVIFDINKLKKVETQILKSLDDERIKFFFHKGDDVNYGSDLIDEILPKIKSGWIYLLDDDNQIHEDFYDEIHRNIMMNPNVRGIIFHQKVSGKDFTGLDIRLTTSENVKVGEIDTAQFLLRRDLISDIKYNQGAGYVSDGVFIQNIFVAPLAPMCWSS